MLERLSLTFDFPPLPPPLEDMARDADALALRYQDGLDRPRIPSFVQSNGRTAYGHLKAIREQTGDPGLSFCEYGCGLGVVSCLADALGWQVTGLDIEEPLLKEARELAKRHGHRVSYVNASYKPDGFFGDGVAPAALRTQSGFDLVRFDVIYVYAWPAELHAVTRFFEDHAIPGTLILIYEGGAKFSVFRAKAGPGEV